MKTTLTILLSIITSLVIAQTFEGKITYTNSYKSKLANVQDQQFNVMLGTTQEYLIKGGKYKTLSNGTLVQWQLYLNKENKLYTKMANSETVFWNDGSIQGDSIIKVEVNKNATVVLGYSCDEVILTCKSGVQKYYFNSKIAVDSKLFVNHKFGNWFYFLSKSNALPLKSIIETAQFTLESLAIAIEPMKLDDKEFQLPVGIKTEKSPY